jgi:hypothetical protein
MPEGESKAHIFSGIFYKTDYTVVFYLLLVAWLILTLMKKILVRRQP